MNNRRNMPELKRGLRKFNEKKGGRRVIKKTSTEQRAVLAVVVL